MKPRVNVFELKKGDKIVDLTTNRIGVITKVKETAPEWIDAFIIYDEKEEILNENNKIKLKC